MYAQGADGELDEPFWIRDLLSPGSIMPICQMGIIGSTIQGCCED